MKRIAGPGSKINCPKVWGGCQHEKTCIKANHCKLDPTYPCTVAELIDHIHTIGWDIEIKTVRSIGIKNMLTVKMKSPTHEKVEHMHLPGLKDDIFIQGLLNMYVSLKDSQQSKPKSTQT